MTDLLKSILELAKTSSYEVVAILLPGALLWHVLQYAGFVEKSSIPDSAIFKMMSAYVLGLGLAGCGKIMLEWAPRNLFQRTRGTSHAEGVARAVILAKIKATFGTTEQTKPENMSGVNWVDVALTTVGSDRVVYDKFTALTDAARSLFVCCLVGVAANLWNHHWIMAVLCLVGTLGTLERYRRFRPLAALALAGVYLAKELPLKKETKE